MIAEGPRPEWLPKMPDRSLPRRRIGLVLGAGGATGAAFHAGAVAHSPRPSIAAVDTSSARRVVFGKDDTSVSAGRTGRVVRDAFLAAGDQIADSVALRETLALDTWRTT